MALKNTGTISEEELETGEFTNDEDERAYREAKKQLTNKKEKTMSKKDKEKKKVKKEKKEKKEKKSKKTKKTERTSRASKSGKYKSMRHMIETMFYKKKDLTKEEADAAVKKEFPDSAWSVNISDKKNEGWGSQFSWYHTHIVNLGEWVVIEPPKWTKGATAKIKKAEKKSKKSED
jgi:phage protein D